LAGTLTGFGLELALETFGFVQGLDLADLTALLDRGHLLLEALGPAGGQTATHQEVAGVTVLDVDDVTRRTEARDLVSQNYLH